MTHTQILLRFLSDRGGRLRRLVYAVENEANSYAYNENKHMIEGFFQRERFARKLINLAYKRYAKTLPTPATYCPQ